MIKHIWRKRSKGCLLIWPRKRNGVVSSSFGCDIVFHSLTPLFLTFPFLQTSDEQLDAVHAEKREGFRKMVELIAFMRSVFERPRNFDAISVLAEITQRTEAVVKTLFPNCEDRTLWDERTVALRSNTQLIVGRAME
jgi:hypothetical protein